MIPQYSGRWIFKPATPPTNMRMMQQGDNQDDTVYYEGTSTVKAADTTLQGDNHEDTDYCEVSSTMKKTSYYPRERTTRGLFSSRKCLTSSASLTSRPTYFDLQT